MKLQHACLVLSLLAVTTGFSQSKDYPLRAVPIGKVRVQGFWSSRVETSRTGIIPTCFRYCEEAGQIASFDRAAGKSMPGTGNKSADSDVYKTIEGACYSLLLHPDPALERSLDILIARIAAAQEPNGYLMTQFRIEKRNRSQRWLGEQYSHELYMMGHLIEAGVAHYQATGKRSLLNLGIKSTDLMLRTFGPDKLRIPPGHQEIELALVRLYRLTGGWKYVELAKFFLEQRGRPEGHKLFDLHNQDLTPVAAQSRAEGHTVRAAYQYAAMADITVLMGDNRYRSALDAIWSDLVSSKVFITGGVGLRGFQPNMGLGLEQFTPPFMLPEERADVDTCSVIGLIFWLHRMNLLQPDGRYGDLIERFLFNRVLAGVSLDGKRFSYGIPLLWRGLQAKDNDQKEVIGTYGRDDTHFRKPWMDCACCPPSLARFLPAIGQYAYLFNDDAVFVDQFFAGEARVSLAGNQWKIRQETGYPWDGAVKLILEAERQSEFTVCLRIPGWARNQAFPSNLYRFADACQEQPSLKVNGRNVSIAVADGYVPIRRVWRTGDVIDLNLPMPIRRVVAHPKVGNLAGKIALHRGPIVFCLEGVDHGGKVLDVALPRHNDLVAEYRPSLLSGVVVLKGMSQEVRKDRSTGTVVRRTTAITAIPYYAWDNRSPGQMVVWVPEAIDCLIRDHP
jgi:hypothetical protein